MAEPPGAQPALGIDAVEWLAMTEGTVTVIVTGRWRRRSTWRGRPVLVIEAQGRRHRFPAIAEPPSVAGASPGTWRMTFTIPARLAPQLGGRCWLQLGGAAIPLPGVVTPVAGRQPAAGRQPDAEDESTAREEVDGTSVPEPGGSTQGQRAPGGPPQVRDPDAVLAAAEELGERVRGLERERRAAQERANAERGRRVQLERELAAARAGPWHPRLGAEVAIARRRRLARPRARPPALAGAERARLALARERAVPAAASGRAAELERRLRDHELRAERLYDVIDELRTLLDGIRGAGDAELGSAGDTPPPVVEPARLDGALAMLKEAIPPVADVSEAEAGAAVGADREAAASSDATASTADVSSMSESVSRAAARSAPAPARRSWLLGALRTIAADDPASAGRIVLGLIPAQRLAYSEPVAYDLVLAEVGCVQVTAGDEGTRVARSPLPRELGQVDFRVSGELASLARLLLTGHVRRRVSRRVARVQGRRGALRALRSLVRTPLGLLELCEGGARLDPPLAFALAATMVDPGEAAQHRFTVGYRDPVRFERAWYLNATGRGRLTVVDTPPPGPVATTIVCEAQLLLSVLAGAEPAGSIVRGATEPLALLRGWLERAQSG